MTNAAGSPLAASAPPASALGPAQFAGAYSLPTSAPSSATIAIVDAYDNPNIESDLAAFDSYYGLPACTTANGCFRKVNQVGGTSYPSKNSGWGLEIALDVETAHEICQSCKILLVEAISPSYANLGAAENEAVALGASVVSNSWGGAESSTESSLDTYFNHPGVVITASAGDSGYGARYPAASPYVVAVGGTSLSLNADNSYKSETAWSGTGSGCSAYEAKPSSQAGYGCARRTIADVSADADPNSGAAVYDTYGYSGWVQVGGTSLASPLIAAVYALSGNTSNGAAPYANPTALHDVTSGSNGSCSPSYLCTAGVGYDGPTGLGSPNGLAAFGGGPPPPPAPDFSVAVSPSSQTVTQGQSASYTVTMTPNSAVGSGDSVTVAAASAPADLTLSGCSSPLTTASPTCTLTATTTGAATSSHTLTITGTGSAGLPTHGASATLGIQAPLAPDYALAVSPSTQTVTQGQGTSYTVTMTPNAAFGSGSVSVAAASAPADVTLSGCTTPVDDRQPDLHADGGDDRRGRHQPRPDDHRHRQRRSAGAHRERQPRRAGARDGRLLAVDLTGEPVPVHAPLDHGHRHDQAAQRLHGIGRAERLGPPADVQLELLREPGQHELDADDHGAQDQQEDGHVHRDRHEQRHHAQPEREPVGLLAPPTAGGPR